MSLAEKLEEFRFDEPDPQKLADTLKNVDMDEVFFYIFILEKHFNLFQTCRFRHFSTAV